MHIQILHPSTEIINREQKKESKKARSLALTWLATRFPHSFDHSQRIRPFQIGIMEEILNNYLAEAEAAGITKSKLRQAVAMITRGIGYLAALKQAEERVDLEGNPCGKVTQEEAEAAAGKIKKRIEKSVRNARSTKHAKMISSYHSKPTRRASVPYNHPNSKYNTANHYNTERSFNSYHAPSSAPKPASVMVKQKRKYDPDAMERLKAKLGLSRKEEVIEGNS